MKIFKKPEQELWAVFAVSEFLLLAAGIWSYFALRGENVPLILHFSPYTGINQIGGLGDLLGVAVTGGVIVAINTGIMFALMKREPFLARLVALATLFISLLLFIAFMAIISVNS